MWMRCHVQTSGVSLVQQEPLNNVIRAAYHALSAILGGAQSLHVDSYDEAYSVPTEEAALLSLRTQQILQEETGIIDVVDPLGGSYYIETLTSDIEKRILDEVDEIERAGGYVAAIESGQLHRKISSYFTNQQKEIEKGDIKIVAYNKYQSDAAPPPINVFRYPEGVEERQRERLARLRQSRDNERVGVALAALERGLPKRGSTSSPSASPAPACAAPKGSCSRFSRKPSGCGSPRPSGSGGRRRRNNPRSRESRTGGQRSVAKKIKVLLAKLGLDVHNRGIITVAKELGDAGMEIVYIGNSLPREIVQTAIQEDVDVIGVSSLGGAHLTLGKPLIDVARQEQLTDSVVFVIGGVFPPDDTVRLKEIGFDAVFTPGATRDEIVHTVQGLVEKKTI